MQPEPPSLDQTRRSRRREPDVHFHETVATSPEGTVYADLHQGSIRVEVHDQASVVVDAEVEGPAADLVSFSLEQDGAGPVRASAVAGRVRIDPALSNTGRHSPSLVVGRLGRGGAPLLLRSAVGGIHVTETTD